MCHNPWIMERTALYGTGLGDQDAQCYVVSGGWGSSSAKSGGVRSPTHSARVMTVRAGKPGVDLTGPAFMGFGAAGQAARFGMQA